MDDEAFLKSLNTTEDIIASIKELSLTYEAFYRYVEANDDFRSRLMYVVDAIKWSKQVNAYLRGDLRAIESFDRRLGGYGLGNRMIRSVR